MATNEAELRRALVLAAEKVMGDAFLQHAGSDGWKTEKSQLNQLIGVCGEALCAEEIENYLRYQASRERKSWGLDLVTATIEGFRGALGSHGPPADDTAGRVQAWRYFAVYLSRAFTYRKKVSDGGNRAERRPR